VANVTEFILRSNTVGVEQGRGEWVAVAIPAGTVLRLSQTLSPIDKRFVCVEWEGRQALIFRVDLEGRGIDLEGHGKEIAGGPTPQDEVSPHAADNHNDAPVRSQAEETEIVLRRARQTLMDTMEEIRGLTASYVDAPKPSSDGDLALKRAQDLYQSAQRGMEDALRAFSDSLKASTKKPVAAEQSCESGKRAAPDES
jgi:hypothetical protein